MSFKSYSLLIWVYFQPYKFQVALPWRRDLVPVEGHHEAALAIGVNDGGLVNLSGQNNCFS